MPSGLKSNFRDRGYSGKVAVCIAVSFGLAGYSGKVAVCIVVSFGSAGYAGEVAVCIADPFSSEVSQIRFVHLTVLLSMFRSPHLRVQPQQMSVLAME